jgi:hypothetical protein
VDSSLSMTSAAIPLHAFADLEVERIVTLLQRRCGKRT